MSLVRQHSVQHGVVHICIQEYRAPGLWVGNAAFGGALDMWSLGCVAAELKEGTLLFYPDAVEPVASDYFRLRL